MKKSSSAMNLLAVLGAFSLPAWAFRDTSGKIGRQRSINSLRGGSYNKYTRHPGNGAQECARRVRQGSAAAALRQPDPTLSHTLEDTNGQHQSSDHLSRQLP